MLCTFGVPLATSVKAVRITLPANSSLWYAEKEQPAHLPKCVSRVIIFCCASLNPGRQKTDSVSITKKSFLKMAALFVPFHFLSGALKQLNLLK